MAIEFDYQILASVYSVFKFGRVPPGILVLIFHNFGNLGGKLKTWVWWCPWQEKKIRDAKGRKVSGNFGKFPWKVSGILKGWEFSEISGIFNLNLFSTFHEIVCTKINRTEFILYYALVLHYFYSLLVCMGLIVYRKTHKALSWDKIELNLSLKFL